VVVIDEPSHRRELVTAALSDIGCRSTCVCRDEALRTITRQRPELVIVGGGDLPALSEVECLHRLQASFQAARYVFLASRSSEELAIRAFQAGASQYIKDPWTPAMLQAVVATLLPEAPASPAAERALVGAARLVGRSQAIRDLRQCIARIALVSSNVLILGETGTGKELVAELIHANSRRAAGPMVCLNSAAIPEALLENELFGHERGAFTGAAGAQSGKLVAANHGTIFLDEIADVSLSVQAKLLRVLESRSIYRLGGIRPQQVDVRMLAATNDDLGKAVTEGRFRKDLYYRLNVVRLELPPLRERSEDIPLLIAHYLRILNAELDRKVKALSTRAMDALCAYHWPGNVREVRNVIEALLVNLAPETTGVVDIPPQVMHHLAQALGAPATERDRLLTALASTNWNKTRAASQLHCSRMTLYRRMHRHHLGLRSAAQGDAAKSAD
jgi:DNA-binding NtrC family response regulator